MLRRGIFFIDTAAKPKILDARNTVAKGAFMPTLALLMDMASIDIAWQLYLKIGK